MERGKQWNTEGRCEICSRQTVCSAKCAKRNNRLKRTSDQQPKPQEFTRLDFLIADYYRKEEGRNAKVHSVINPIGTVCSKYEEQS